MDFNFSNLSRIILEHFTQAKACEVKKISTHKIIFKIILDDGI